MQPRFEPRSGCSKACVLPAHSCLQHSSLIRSFGSLRGKDKCGCSMWFLRLCTVQLEEVLCSHVFKADRKLSIFPIFHVTAFHKTVASTRKSSPVLAPEFPQLGKTTTNKQKPLKNFCLPRANSHSGFNLLAHLDQE